MTYHLHSAVLVHAAQSAAAPGSAAQGMPLEATPAQPYCLPMPLGMRAHWATA